MKIIKKRWWILLFIPLLLITAFAVWALTGPKGTAEAQAALKSDSLVTVEIENWLVFNPVDYEPTTGLILYPGGRVDPAAYAPLARDIAAEGYLVVIPPMPLNLAFLAPERALEIMDAFPQIAHWAVGGHSLGGAMAANFANSHPESVDGLLLWAAYPSQSDDLSEQDLEVMSIYGTNDGLASAEEINNSKALLPPDTNWVEIAGGNHAQFGSYGPQSGDNTADISSQVQQAQIVQATILFLNNLAGTGR